MPAGKLVKIPRCEQHIEYTMIMPETSKHKACIRCQVCNKFIKWESLKTPEQKVIDKKRHIYDYFNKQWESNRFNDLFD